MIERICHIDSVLDDSIFFLCHKLSENGNLYDKFLIKIVLVSALIATFVMSDVLFA